MAEITAALVKDLREKTGVGMMDCKKALQETDGDINAAIDWLRAKGLSKAAKKADRVAAEGLVAVASKEVGAGEVGAAIEFNAETDFVGRNDQFQKFVATATRLALENGGDLGKVAAAPFPGTGRDLALQRGANVFMPNATPGRYRKDYLLYPGKPCVDESADQCGACVIRRIKALGRTLGQGPGHSRKGTAGKIA